MAASIAGKISFPVRNHWQAVWAATDDMPTTVFCGVKNGNGGNPPTRSFSLYWAR